MGQEIETTNFTPGDFLDFSRRLDAETEMLGRQLGSGRFLSGERAGGFELETWLIDRELRPAPINEAFLERLDNPLVVPELARFNVELNGAPQALAGRGLRLLHEELERTWKACSTTAAGLDAELAAIGIWPTATEEDLHLGNMSDQHRYRALNEQLLRLRGGVPTHVDIDGEEHLELEFSGVMLESMATSFQLHLQTDPLLGARHFNAAHVVAAPLVAAATNSPYLFGRDLWAETRIPLFEQAAGVGAAGGPQRVTFGHGYLRHGTLELFERNRKDFPVMLPVLCDGPPERFEHLCLHNSTIWRWNRLLIGFTGDGQPHLRLEHRTMPSGPTLVDCLANAALFFGLVEALATDRDAAEERLPFATARDNFYAAARYGLDARITWLGGRSGTVGELLATQLLATARRGLERLGIERDDREDYLEVIEARVRTGRTGSAWQRNWVARHGADMGGLAAAYLAGQRSARSSP